MRAGFDLLTGFRQGEYSVDEWYNAVQTQVALAKYPQETACWIEQVSSKHSLPANKEVWKFSGHSKTKWNK